jgi:hypothetical protein
LRTDSNRSQALEIHQKYNRFLPNLTRSDGSAFEALMGSGRDDRLVDVE